MRPLVDDVDAVGEFAHDAQIVRDEEHRRMVTFHHVAHQLQRLRLNGHVERGAWLVGDQQGRLVGQRHGDHDALVHAAGKLERIGIEHAHGHRAMATSASWPQRDLARPARLDIPAFRASAPRGTGCSIEKTGLSDEVGSWKIIDMRVPRSR